MKRSLMAAVVLCFTAGMARADIWNFMVDRFKVGSGTLSASQFNDSVTGTQKVKLSAAEPGATIGTQTTIISVTNNQPSGTVFTKSVYVADSLSATPFMAAAAGGTSVGVLVPSTATSLRICLRPETATAYVRCEIIESGAEARANTNTLITVYTPLIMPMIKIGAMGATVYLNTVETQGTVFGSVSWTVPPTNY